MLKDINNILNVSQNSVKPYYIPGSQSVDDTPPARDPLALDLDGDGLELVGINDRMIPMMFGYNGDGVLNPARWLAPDDAFLAHDRDGNGQILDGSELFNVMAPKCDGSDFCVDGFEALAQEDTNEDVIVNASDANWSALRLRRDLSQNGRVDESELSIMKESGIVGLTVAPDDRRGSHSGRGAYGDSA